MDSGMDALFSFNLTRPQPMTERNNPDAAASRTLTENSPSFAMRWMVAEVLSLEPLPRIVHLLCFVLVLLAELRSGFQHIPIRSSFGIAGLAFRAPSEENQFWPRGSGSQHLRYNCDKARFICADASHRVRQEHLRSNPLG